MFSFSHTFFYQTSLHPQQMGVLKERSQKALGVEWKSQYDGTQGVIAASTPSTKLIRNRAEGEVRIEDGLRIERI